MCRLAAWPCSSGALRRAVTSADTLPASCTLRNNRRRVGRRYRREPCRCCKMLRETFAEPGVPQKRGGHFRARWPALCFESRGAGCGSASSQNRRGPGRRVPRRGGSDFRLRAQLGQLRHTSEAVLCPLRRRRSLSRLIVSTWSQPLVAMMMAIGQLGTTGRNVHRS